MKDLGPELLDIAQKIKAEKPHGPYGWGWGHTQDVGNVEIGICKSQDDNVHVGMDDGWNAHGMVGIFDKHEAIAVAVQILIAASQLEE